MLQVRMAFDYVNLQTAYYRDEGRCFYSVIAYEALCNISKRFDMEETDQYSMSVFLVVI